MEPFWIVFAICFWLMMMGVFIDFINFIWQALQPLPRKLGPRLRDSNDE
jgi:hypothetical protein